MLNKSTNIVVSILLVCSYTASFTKQSVANCLDYVINNTDSAADSSNSVTSEFDQQQGGNAYKQPFFTSYTFSESTSESNYYGEENTFDTETNIIDSTTDDSSSNATDDPAVDNGETTTDAFNSVTTPESEEHTEETTLDNEPTTWDTNVDTTESAINSEENTSDNESKFSISTTDASTPESEDNTEGNTLDTEPTDSTKDDSGGDTTESITPSGESTSDNEINISAYTPTFEVNPLGTALDTEPSDDEISISTKNTAKGIGRSRTLNKPVARSINKFGDELYKILAKNGQNVVFSPFSLHAALSMLAFGANGKTRAELLSKLNFKSLNTLKSAYSTEFKHNYKEQVRIVNNIFYDSTIHLRKVFTTVTKNIFKANPTKVNFAEATKTEKYINEWVANKTKYEIQHLLPDKSLEDRTMVVLVNAIYFKKKWSMKFNKRRTIKNFTFKTTKGKVKCDMMVMEKSKHLIYSSPMFRILVLPFTGSRMKIAFILPPLHKLNSQEPTLDKIEEMLDDRMFFESTKQLRLKEVVIRIPKFKLSSSFSLAQDLISLGLPRLFDKPNFSSLFNTSLPLVVNKVLQATTLEVDENGAKAVSATALGLNGRTTRPEFILDIPFLFVLYDNKSEIIMIRGRVENPTV